TAVLPAGAGTLRVALVPGGHADRPGLCCAGRSIPVVPRQSPGAVWTLSPLGASGRSRFSAFGRCCPTRGRTGTRSDTHLLVVRRLCPPGRRSGRSPEQSAEVSCCGERRPDGRLIPRVCRPWLGRRGQPVRGPIGERVGGGSPASGGGGSPRGAGRRGGPDPAGRGGRGRPPWGVRLGAAPARGADR